MHAALALALLASIALALVSASPAHISDEDKEFFKEFVSLSACVTQVTRPI